MLDSVRWPELTLIQFMIYVAIISWAIHLLYEEPRARYMQQQCSDQLHIDVDLGLPLCSFLFLTTLLTLVAYVPYSMRVCFVDASPSAQLPQTTKLYEPTIFHRVSCILHIEYMPYYSMECSEYWSIFLLPVTRSSMIARFAIDYK